MADDYNTYSCSDLSEAVRARLSKTFRSYFVAQGQAAAVEDVLITKIVSSKQPSFDWLKAVGVIGEELNVLLDMNAVNIFLAETFPKNANVVGTRIDLEVKKYKTEEERWRARIVFQECMN